MKFSPYFAFLAAALCASLLSSCTSDIEAPQPVMSYCVFPEGKICLQGDYSECPPNWILSNGCPYSSSSGPLLPSSSGTTSSSSSGGFSGNSSSSNNSGNNSSSSSGGFSGNSSSSQQSGIVYGPSVNYGDEIYRTVKIGDQTWFQRNLNYNPGTGNSRCNDCARYGRLYDWSTAMGISSNYNSNNYNPSSSTKYRGVCPEGWHIPNNAEWDKLMRYVDGSTGTSSPYDSKTAGRYLKATDGWNSGGNGVDKYGFSALPGGYGDSDGSFGNAGSYGNWWSSSEDISLIAYYRSMRYSNEYAYWYLNGKSGLFSVRCLQD